jgi:hypothetical protein
MPLTIAIRYKRKYWEGFDRVQRTIICFGKETEITQKNNRI